MQTKSSLPSYLRGINDDADVTIPPKMAEALQRIVEKKQRQYRSERWWRIAARVRDVTFFSTVAVVSAILLAQAMDNTPPVRLTQSLAKDAVRPGERLKVNLHVWERTRTSCDIRVTYTAFDGEGGFRSVTSGWLPPITRKDDSEDSNSEDFVRYVTIPHDAVPGSGLLRITREWRCPYNVIQRVWPITEVPAPLPFRIEGPGP